MMERKVSTSHLKAHGGEIIDSVVKDGKPVTITRYGRPVARLVPAEPPKEIEPKSRFGFAKGWITIKGDIIEPIDVEWDANK